MQKRNLVNHLFHKNQHRPCQQERKNEYTLKCDPGGGGKVKFFQEKKKINHINNYNKPKQTKPFYLKDSDYHTGKKRTKLLLYMRSIFKYKDTDTLKENGQEIIQHANTFFKKLVWLY